MTVILSVVLLTYNRLAYAIKTLNSTLDKLDHDSRLPLHVHIGSDGDTDEYIAELVQAAKQYDTVDVVTMSNSQRKGYGANYNMATQVVHELSDYALVLEDDWELLRLFDPVKLIEDMKSLSIGCARLGYLGYTQQLRGHLAAGSYCQHWMVFDPYSPEPHVFAGHPRIESREWSRAVGAWPEGMAPGETEFTVSHRAEARRGVAWPVSLVQPHGDLYAHIGTERSY